MGRKIKLNKLYEGYSLGVSLSLIVAVLYYFLFYPEGCILETSELIRSVEIFIGFSVFPYYYFKLIIYFTK